MTCLPFSHLVKIFKNEYASDKTNNKVDAPCVCFTLVYLGNSSTIIEWQRLDINSLFHSSESWWLLEAMMSQSSLLEAGAGSAGDEHGLVLPLCAMWEWEADLWGLWWKQNACKGNICYTEKGFHLEIKVTGGELKRQIYKSQSLMRARQLRGCLMSVITKMNLYLEMYVWKWKKKLYSSQHRSKLNNRSDLFSAKFQTFKWIISTTKCYRQM